MNCHLAIGCHFPRKLFLFLSLCLVAWGSVYGLVVAQSESNGWESPWNVSVSGTATEPIIAVSATGVFHIFWQDRLGGYMLMRQQGSDWREPQRVLVPFTNPPFSPVVDTEDFGGFYKPLLRVDGDNVLHALWLDDEGMLSYSYAPLAQLGEAESWSVAVVVAPAARGFDLVAGENGRLHMAYIQATPSAQVLPGVYYRQSEDGGASWSDPTLIYESNYLRPVAAGAANLQLAQTAAGQVFLVWDNPLLETVFLARSVNFGVSWEAPMVVDRRMEGDALESPGASDISALVDGATVHLVWYAGHKPRTCTIYHQISADGGESWLPYESVIDLGLECPEESLLLLDNNDLLFLLVKRVLRATERTEIFLQAWDGTQWSTPELQEALTDYQDPETYRKVSFDCLQGDVTQANHLLLVTCGSTRSLRDVWVLERPLGELTDWSERFAPPSVWSNPTLAANSSSMVDHPLMLLDAQGNRHLFWQGEGDDDLSKAIYYTTWNQQEWSRPLPVLELSAEVDGRYNVAIDPVRQRFLALWHDAGLQELLLSQVEVDAAVLATDWSPPQSLVKGAVKAETIIIDAAGTIYLPYSIPINEGRGVYLIESVDGGTNWSEPLLLFDAAEADWFGVGAPQLQLDPGNRFHLVLTRQFSFDKIGLYYAFSPDGRTWSTPEERFAGNVVWSQLLVDRLGAVHLLWSVEENNRTTTWHIVSKDNGAVWQPATPITDLVGTYHNIALAQDAAGSIYLLQVQDHSLLNRRWDGTRWLSLDSLNLTATTNQTIAQLTALPNGRNLDVIYVSHMTNPANETSTDASVVTGSSAVVLTAPMQDALYLAQQQIDLPADLQLPTPPALPTPSPSPTSSAPPVLSTPTPSLPLQGDLEQPASGTLVINNPILQTLLSVTPALLIVALVFGFVAFRMVKR